MEFGIEVVAFPASLRSTNEPFRRKKGTRGTHSLLRLPGFLGLNFTGGALAPRTPTVVVFGVRLSSRPAGGAIGAIGAGGCNDWASADASACCVEDRAEPSVAGVEDAAEAAPGGGAEAAAPRRGTTRGFAFSFGGMVSELCGGEVTS